MGESFWFRGTRNLGGKNLPSKPPTPGNSSSEVGEGYGRVRMGRVLRREHKESRVGR